MGYRHERAFIAGCPVAGHTASEHEVVGAEVGGGGAEQLGRPGAAAYPVPQEALRLVLGELDRNGPHLGKSGLPAVVVPLHATGTSFGAWVNMSTQPASTATAASPRGG